MNAVQNFSMYNNMYFRTGAGKTGYIKAGGENIVLFSLDEYVLSRLSGERVPKVIARDFVPDDITLVPRDPEVFCEFRVGDILVKRGSDLKDSEFATVVARFGNTIILENLGNFKEMTDINKAFASGWRLNLTLFEQKLLEEENEKKEENLEREIR